MNMRLTKRVEALENCGGPIAGIIERLAAGRARSARGPLSKEQALARIEAHREQGFDDLARALERTLIPHKENA